MNVNSMIKNALSSLNMPVYANVYDGNKEEYITFNYADERPALRADDTDLYDETVIQVHYFTKENPQANKKTIRRLLREAGFNVINTVDLYETDTKYHHIVVEVWIDGIIDD
jgi:hypothetical protein